MAGHSLRDRFFTPPVARAIVSPTALLALAVGAAAGFAAGAEIAGAVALGLLAFVLRVVLAIPRRSRGTRIDPFTLDEPWRHYVRDAVQARNRFNQAVDRALEGPTRDRLAEIDERVGTGVLEVWRIAQRGHALAEARGRVDPAAIRRKLDAASGATTGATLERTTEALGAQLATAERLERVIADADSRLRLLNARLDEAAARTIELSVQAGDVADLSGLGDDVDTMVDEMEALRLAIEETGGGTAVAGPG